MKSNEKLTRAGRSSRLGNKERGFTLMELLVTISVALVLAALVISGIGRASTKAGVAKCISNLRAIGVASLTYAAENNGLLAGFDRGEANGTTTENVTSYGYDSSIAKKLVNGGYVDNLDLFFCPVDKARLKMRKDGEGWAKLPTGGGEYNSSGYWFFYVKAGTGNKNTESKFSNRARAGDPSRGIIAYDQRDYAGAKGAHPQKDINILRLDGSVENVPYNAIDPNNGINAFIDLEPPKGS